MALTFDPIQNLSTSSLGSISPQIAVSGSNIFVVWEDGVRSDPFQGCQGMCDIFFRRSTDQGLTWDPALDQPAVQLSSGSAYSIAPQVVASGNIVLVFWADLGGVGVAYRRSADGGKTFGQIQPITAGPPPRGLGQIQAVVSGSVIHVTWAEQNAVLEIFYSRSTNTGVTFEPAVMLSDIQAPCDTEQNVHLAVNGNIVAVVWERRCQPAITFRGSTNGGATFGPLIGLSAPTQAGGEQPLVAVNGSNIYVTWHEAAIAGQFDIFYRRSTDGGTTFEPFQSLSGTGQAGPPTSIAVSGANVYVVWPDTDGEVFFRRSTDQGSTFQAIQNLSAVDGPVSIPSQVVANGSNVYVAWNKPAPWISPSEVLFRSSPDGGTTWSPALDQPATNLSATPGTSVQQQVAVSGGNIYAVWADSTSGNSDIFFRRSKKFSLTFPLRGTRPGIVENLNAYTAPIVSVFDHSMKDKKGTYRLYQCDEVVEAYTGEIGNLDPDVKGCPNYPGYTQAGNIPFQVNGHYVGASGHPEYLNYDGHPGIDFRAADETEVYAVANGTIWYPKNIVGIRTPPNEASKTYHVLELAPDDAPGYKIYYLHLSTHPATGETVDKNDATLGCPAMVTLPLPEGTHVNAGCLIALSGHAGPKGTPPHLHFEVQKVLPLDQVKNEIRTAVQCVDSATKACVPIDPYGWDAGSSISDPYESLTGVSNIWLWAP